MHILVLTDTYTNTTFYTTWARRRCSPKKSATHPPPSDIGQARQELLRPVAFVAAILICPGVFTHMLTTCAVISSP